MKKIALLTVLTLMMSITALGGCAEGTNNGMNANATEIALQSAQGENVEKTFDENLTIDENVNEDTEGDNAPEEDDCDDNNCKDGKNGDNETPEHRHRPPRKGHRRGHGRRPHPRPMPKKFR